MMDQILRRRVGNVYADFGFSMAEVCRCAFCGASEYAELDRGFSLIGYSVPITAHCPVAGMVGACVRCYDTLREVVNDPPGRVVLRPNVFDGRPYTLGQTGSKKKTWKPPLLIQPIPRVPVYLLPREFCNDTRLKHCIGATWTRIDRRSRRVLRDHWTEPWREGAGFCKGALRVEALPNWPERAGPYLGDCLNDGHAIRLHIRTVSDMPDDVLMTLFSHELAHAYQAATLPDRPREWTEQGAIEVMRGWGFKDHDINVWSYRQQREKQQARRVKRLLKHGERERPGRSDRPTPQA